MNNKGAVPKRPPKPKKSSKNPANQDISIYLCQICSVEDDIGKVRCDGCLLWYHFNCAKITSDVGNQEFWMCANCEKEGEQNPPPTAQNTKLIDIEEENPFGYSKLPPPKDQVFEEPIHRRKSNEDNRSHKTHSDMSSVSRRASLALQKLAEERKMLEARDKEARERDKEYLNKKYAILEDDEMSNLSFDDEELIPFKDDSVKRWAENARLQNKIGKNATAASQIINKDANQREKTIVPMSNSNKLFDNMPANHAMHESSPVTDRQNRERNQIEKNVRVPVTANQEFSQSNRMFGDMVGRLSTRSDQLIDELIVGISSTDKPSINYSIETLPDWLTKPKPKGPSDTHPGFNPPTLQSMNFDINVLSTNHLLPVNSTVSQRSNIDLSKLARSQAVYDKPSARPGGIGSEVLPSSLLSTKEPKDSEKINLPQDSQENQASSIFPYITSSADKPRSKISTKDVLIEYPSAYTRINYNIDKRQNDIASIFEPTGSSNQHSGAAHDPATHQLFNTTTHTSSVPQFLGLHYQQNQQPITSYRQTSEWLSNSQSIGIKQPQSLGNYQSSYSNQRTIGTTLIMSTGQPIVSAQSQSWGSFQPIASNYQPIVSAQSQPSGSFQPIASNYQNFGSTFLSNSQTLSSQSFGTQQSFGTNQSFGTSQPFGSGQPLSTSQTFIVSQPNVSNMSTSGYQQYTPISNSNYVPVSHLSHMNQSVNANNGNYQSFANGSMITQGRITAEQIAARHVMPRDLPQFSGDPNEWETFISAYENSNDACGFTNSENLGRLQKCLKGDARTAVRSRLLHKDSVPGVIETLRMMYGRPELIIETMIRDIQKLPSPKDDDLPSLIKFAISIQNLSATIQNLGAFEHLRNPMLINSITDKLPSQHQLNWAFQKRAIGEVHIGHLGDWLYQIADVASRVVRVSSKSHVKKSEQKDNKNKSDSSRSNTFLNTQVEKTLTNNNHSKFEAKKCPACNSSKCTKLVHCKKFKEATRAERWIMVKKGNLCGRCFGPHKFYRCQSEQSCSVEGCKSNHHTLLHNHETSSEASPNNDKNSSGEKSKSTDLEKKTCNSQRSKFKQRTDKFRIVPVMLHFKDKSVRDYAYLDDGSNMTTIEDSLADELELTGSSKELCVDWAFGQTHSVENSRIVAVKISGYYENAPRFNMTNVRTVKHLHLPTQSITTTWIDQYPHFKNVPIATYESVKPRLLIGLQYSKLIVSLETIEGRENEPIVCKTRLGWVVQGPTYESDSSSNKPTYSMNMCMCRANDNELHQLVKDYFAMEHIGIKIPENILESKEMQRAKQILDSTTVKRGDRYETGLLWKYDDVELPESYNMALKRLICLEAKMLKNPELKQNLCNQIKQFVEKGYIRKLSKDEIKNVNQRVWYLPTFPVFNPKKPEKVRLVWDGAAKANNTSLNSNLLVGPDQLVPLPELLRRFRERKIALTGDIAEMYHQVIVQEKDQHAQRFLWREDSSKEPDIYIMMVMTFGSKCSPSAAQYVKNKNASEFQEKFPRAAEAIIANHYVDDMIDCTDTVEEAETLVKEVKMIHRAGGFNIRNFTSNSEELLTRIGENLVPKNKDLNIDNKLGTERVLGMFWDTVNDTFTYSLKFTAVNEKMLSGEYCPTKREVLQILMSVFDPLGLVANFLVYGKIILQEVWRSSIEWDEKLTPPVYNKWIQWIRALPNVEKLQIPRWYSTKLSPNLPKSIQLHTFVDASVEACAAATYLRIEDDDGVDCCLVGAKTKVAPNKPMSVPRLELQAAIIGTRLAENIKSSQKLTFEKHIFWSDSQTVMGWINSDARRYNQFVAFRIGEILETTEPNQWRWVPTKHNVADEATKSKVIPKLESNSRWFKAPKFLYESERSWFSENVKFDTEDELRPCFVLSMREVEPEQLINLERFSQWNRLVRTQAYLLRFVHNWKSTKNERRIGLLSQEELIQAEISLYHRAQRDVFLDEILILKHNQKVPLAEHRGFEKSSELRTLSPYLDENNVLRMRSRLDAATGISHDTKRPIILPRRHRVTKLLVDWYHRQYKHLNHQTALNEIQQKYVIPALRVVMKQVRSSCQKCKNSSAMPRIPEMAGLPPARLATFTRPFTFTGVDYFGPYYVKVNRSQVKRYGVLFTCMTVRAVHLEVADSLNTSSCIKAIRRFAADKGQPSEFFSDNGTNFHGTDNELKEEFAKLNRDLIQQEFTTAEQKWTFNPPTASHMGGAWERLIRTVKSCLKQMLTTKTPTQEMLVTLMKEVQNIVNSRPLTYVSLESTDDEALTPNHFIFGSSNALKPIGETTRHDLLRNDWRAIQEMTNHFWNRFVLEYLPDLTKRTKWFTEVEPIKVGDVVLVIDNRNPRNTWPRGIVEEVFIGRDGRIRHVMVRFGNRVLPRPVSKLAILDVVTNKIPNSQIKHLKC